jgi:hypothetical protein
MHLFNRPNLWLGINWKESIGKENTVRLCHLSLQWPVLPSRTVGNKFGNFSPFSLKHRTALSEIFIRLAFLKNFVIDRAR